VILGWITVGVQYRSDTVDAALGKEEAYRALEHDVVSDNLVVNLEDEQRGLVVRSGLAPQPHHKRSQTAQDGMDAPHLANLELPMWCGADVRGDERKRGPIYNYARIFTWWQLASTIEQALRKTLDNIADGKACDETHTARAMYQRTHSGSPPPLAWNQTHFAPQNLNAPTSPTQKPSATTSSKSTITAASSRTWDDTRGELNLLGDISQTARYCGLSTQAIEAYPWWSGDCRKPGLSAAVYRRIFAASMTAIFVQWGTTGASMLMAYLTPTIGLGCRSGSYLLYGILGTVVWMCLLISQLLSHQVMLRYQEVHIHNPSMDFGDREQRQEQGLTGFGFALLRGSAVSLRYIGKAIAILNTGWLIASSLLEFIGGFDNCWCNGNVLGLGDKGWVVLFKGDADLAAAARLPLGGGLAMTFIVCTASYIFFALGSWKADDD
jgi:hypothetical protein